MCLLSTQETQKRYKTHDLPSERYLILDLLSKDFHNTETNSQRLAFTLFEANVLVTLSSLFAMPFPGSLYPPDSPPHLAFSQRLCLRASPPAPPLLPGPVMSQGMVTLLA
jgi:hypothetical protein